MLEQGLEGGCLVWTMLETDTTQEMTSSFLAVIHWVFRISLGTHDHQQTGLLCVGWTCTCQCMCVCLPVYSCMWRLQVDIVFLRLLSTLKDWDFHWTQSSLMHLVWLVSDLQGPVFILLSSELGLWVSATVPAFICGFWGSSRKFPLLCSDLLTNLAFSPACKTQVILFLLFL